MLLYKNKKYINIRKKAYFFTPVCILVQNIPSYLQYMPLTAFPPILETTDKSKTLLLVTASK